MKRNSSQAPKQTDPNKVLEKAGMDAFRAKVHTWAQQERDRISEMRAFFDQPLGEGEFDFKKFQENRKKEQEIKQNTEQKQITEMKRCQ